MTQRSGCDAAPNWISLMVSPDELDAMITSGGSSSSSWPYSFFLKSIRSGPFSWTRSTPPTACASAAVKFRFDCDAPEERPNRLSAGQAVSTNFLSAASAFGAMSVATTCSPLARNSAVQLAPITPVPMMAMRRMGLVSVITFLRCLLDFGIGDAGEVALGVKEVALVLAVEIGGIDRTGQIRHEHPVAGNVEGDADSLHQVRDQDLRRRSFVDRRAIDGVAARRIAAVGPIEHAIRQIELEIDGLRQVIEEHLDVGALRRTLALRDVDVSAEQTALAALVRPLLRPVDFPELRIDGDSDAPAGLIVTVLVAAARLDQRLDVRAVEIAAHDPHPFAVAPIELPVLLIEMHLLRRVCAAFRDDDSAIAAVEVGALNRAVIDGGIAHVGPIDVTRRYIHGDAVGETGIRDDGLFVGPVWVHRVNEAGVQFENKQATDCSIGAG